MVVNWGPGEVWPDLRLLKRRWKLGFYVKHLFSSLGSIGDLSSPARGTRGRPHALCSGSMEC